MNKKLEGKVAIVTGAARGIGAGVALEFVRQGAKVWYTRFARMHWFGNTYRPRWCDYYYYAWPGLSAPFAGSAS